VTKNFVVMLECFGYEALQLKIIEIENEIESGEFQEAASERFDEISRTLDRFRKLVDRVAADVEQKRIKRRRLSVPV